MSEAAREDEQGGPAEELDRDDVHAPGAPDDAARDAADLEAARAEGRSLITGQGMMIFTFGAIFVMFAGIFGFAYCAFMP